jgi:hypothetical protein
VMFPFALLMFHVYQYVNIMVSFQSQWHFVVLFLLIGLLLLPRETLNWGRWVLLMLCALGATFSLGSGFIVWGVISLVWWLRGERRLQFALPWIVVGAAVVAWYLSGDAVSVSTGDGAAEGERFGTVALELNADVLRFWFIMLGSPFAAHEATPAAWIGAAGLALFTINAAWLWWRKDHRRSTAIWIGVALYGVLAALLIALSRVNEANPDDFALLPRYITLSMLLWIGLIALVVLLWRERPLVGSVRYLAQRTLFGINLGLALVMGGGYLQTVAWGIQDMVTRHEFALSTEVADDYVPDDACYRDFPLYRDLNCLDPWRLDGGRIPERIYRLAVHRLTIFADDDPVNILPPTYDAGSPVVLHAPSQWLTLYMREWLFDGINEDVLFHVGVSPNDFPTGELDHPPLRTETHFSPEALARLADFIDAAQQVWFMTTPEVEADAAPFFDQLRTAGYVATPYPIQAERFRIAEFVVWRFQQAPTITETVLSFGEEGIRLEDWTLVDEPIACQTLRLQSWWRSGAVPEQNYSLTLVLRGADGNPVLNRDAAIGDTLMQLWEPEQFYFDERLLTLPCDLPAGDYDMALGLYAQGDGGFADLTAMDADGNPLGTRPALVEITVRNE